MTITGALHRVTYTAAMPARQLAGFALPFAKLAALSGRIREPDPGHKRCMPDQGPTVGTGRRIRIQTFETKSEIWKRLIRMSFCEQESVQNRPAVNTELQLGRIHSVNLTGKTPPVRKRGQEKERC